MRYTNVSQIPQFTRAPSYQCDVSWDYIEEWYLENKPDLDPDFQREHVWSRAQQIAFIEFCLRGGTSGRNIYFNARNFRGGSKEDLVMVDGKQRLTAVIRWLRDEYPVFGDTWRYDLQRFSFSNPNTSFRIHINDLRDKSEILTWYLEMNSGGTPHTKEELLKVERLLNEELTKAA